MIHLDTHVVIWLYAGEINRFPETLRDAMDSEELAISPAVIMELQYLFEIDRIVAEAPRIVETLASSIGLVVADTPFRSVISESLSESWTRDPFDRMIVAQAKAEAVRLVTKDVMIRRHYPDAIWDV